MRPDAKGVDQRVKCNDENANGLSRDPFRRSAPDTPPPLVASGPAGHLESLRSRLNIAALNIAASTVSHSMAPMVMCHCFPHHSPHCYCSPRHIPLKAFIMSSTAGPSSTMNSAGRIHSINGKITLTGIFIAFSSAR